MIKSKLTSEEITIARKAIAEYLKFTNKISKQKCWEEGQVLGGFFMWLGEQQED